MLKTTLPDPNCPQTVFPPTMIPGSLSASAGILITCVYAGLRDFLPWWNSGDVLTSVNDRETPEELLSDKALNVLSRVLENLPACVCNVFAEKASDQNSSQSAVNLVIVLVLCGLCFGLGICVGCLWCLPGRQERACRAPPHRIDVASLDAARRRAREISE